jgi:hypothetical protein
MNKPSCLNGIFTRNLKFRVCMTQNFGRRCEARLGIDTNTYVTNYSDAACKSNKIKNNININVERKNNTIYVLNKFIQI